jgi:hypothetical protein
VPIGGKMDKGNVLCVYNGIRFSLKVEGTPVVFSKADEPGKHHVKESKLDRERQTLLTLYVKSKKGHLRTRE